MRARTDSAGERRMSGATLDGEWSVELLDHPIDLASRLAAVSDPDVGSHGWFCGVTRRTTGNRVTHSLHYEAYHPMAERELQRLAAEAAQRFGLKRLLIVHRLGEVPVGEASVVVGCSSPHRDATFQALPWILNELKTQVPIWKRERFSDGSSDWVHPGFQR